MVAGWLWWLAVPFVAALLLRLLSFVPGVKPLLHHHAERWLIVFGILVVGIAVIAACHRHRDHAPGQPGPGRRLDRRPG